MGALLGAIFGAMAGFCTGFISEKLRGRLTAIRHELSRLDELHDEAGGVLYDLNARREINPSALQRVDRLRTRLGQNLRRVGYSTGGWLRVQAALDGFQQQWIIVEGAALDDPAAAPDIGNVDLDAAIGTLRRAIDTSSQQFPVWRLMGPC